MNTNGPLIIGKNSPAVGKCPAVLLIDPKYKANVGAIQRAAARATKMRVAPVHPALVKEQKTDGDKWWKVKLW